MTNHSVSNASIAAVIRGEVTAAVDTIAKAKASSATYRDLAQQVTSSSPDVAAGLLFLAAKEDERATYFEDKLPKLQAELDRWLSPNPAPTWVKSNVIERKPTGRRYRVLPGTASAGKIGEEVKSWPWGGKDLDLGDGDVRTFANGDIEETNE